MNKPKNTVTINLRNQALNVKLVPATSKQVNSKPDIRPPEYCSNCDSSSLALFNMHAIIVPHNSVSLKFVSCFELCTGKRIDDAIAEPKICLKCWQQIKADFEAKAASERPSEPAPIAEVFLEDPQVEDDGKLEHYANVFADSEEKPRGKIKVLVQLSDSEMEDEGDDENIEEIIPDAPVFADPEDTGIVKYKSGIMVRDSSNSSEGEKTDIEEIEYTTNVIKQSKEKPVIVQISEEEYNDFECETEEEGAGQTKQIVQDANDLEELEEVSSSNASNTDLFNCSFEGSEKLNDDNTNSYEDTAEINTSEAGVVSEDGTGQNVNVHTEIPRLKNRSISQPESLLEYESISERLEKLTAPKTKSASKRKLPHTSAMQSLSKSSKNDDFERTSKDSNGSEISAITGANDSLKADPKSLSEYSTSVMLQWRDKHSQSLFECKLCTTAFASLYSLYVHSKIVHKDINPALPTAFEQNVRMFSEDCKELLTDLKELDCSEIAYYLCNKCENQYFLSYHEFKQHFQVQHYRLPIKMAHSYQCDICKSEFRSFTAYNENRKKCIQALWCDRFVDMPGNFQCKLCIISFPTATELIKHCDNYHAKSDPKLPTIFEKNILMFKTDDKKVKEFSKNVLYFMCKKCERLKFVNYHQYKQHVMRVHCLNQATVFTCNICCATYTTIPELLSHGKRVNHKISVPGVNDFKCDYCHLHFESEDIRRYHVMHIHKGEQLELHDKYIESKIQCRFCQENFGSSQKLVNHVRQKHNDADIKSPTIIELYMQMFEHNDTQLLEVPKLSCVAYFKCMKCEHLRFIKYYTYKDHVLKAHGPPNNERTTSSQELVQQHNNIDKHSKYKMECRHCFKSFKSYIDFSRHFQEAHKDVDPKVQTIFERNIQMFSADKTEILNHFDTKNVAYYQCRPCSAKYAFYNNVKRHVANCHTDVAQESNESSLEEALKEDESPVYVSTDRWYTCQVCYATFLSSEEYKTHIKQAQHLQRKTLVTVKKNPIITERIEPIKDEMLWRDKYVKYRLECKICQKSKFNKQSTLYKHCKAEHKDVDPTVPTLCEKSIEFFGIDGKPKEGTDSNITSLKCKLCNSHFFAYHKYKSHILNVHGSESDSQWRDKHVAQGYSCKICQSFYTTMSSLVHHCRTIHKDVNPALPTKSEIHIQMFTANGTEILNFENNAEKIAYYMCKKCVDLRFTDYFKFRSHYVMLHERRAGCSSFTCSICYATFMSANDYGTHFHEDKHLTIQKDSTGSFVCPLCGGHFLSKKHLKEHQENTHDIVFQSPSSSSEDDQFECEQCCLVFTTKHLLLVHNITEHEDQQPPSHRQSNKFLCYDKQVKDKFECRMCQKSFRQFNSLCSHMGTHHPAEDQSVATVCELNMQMFDAKDTELLDHSVSINVAYYRCRLCKNLKFFFYHDFKQHVIVAHGKVVLRKTDLDSHTAPAPVVLWHDKYSKFGNECRICHANFRTIKGLYRHCTIAHTNVEPSIPTIFELNIQLFAADDTEIVDDDGSTVTTNVAYYKCKICEKLKFATYGNYKSHVNFVHQRYIKSASFTCGVCFFTYYDSIELCLHMKHAKHLAIINLKIQSNSCEIWRDQFITYRDVREFQYRHDCKICTLFFPNSKYLLIHAYKMHKGIDPAVPTTFERNVQVFAYDDTEILDDSDPRNVAYFKCRQCKLHKFDKYFSYKEHVSGGHRPSVPEINKDLKVMKSTKIKWHDEHVNPGYECRLCLMVLYDDDLCLHYEIEHSGVDLALPTIFELNIQMFSADGIELTSDTDLKNVEFYKCKKCKTPVFTDYHEFKLHVHVVHELMKSNPSCVCRECKATFTTMSGLVSHMNSNKHLKITTVEAEIASADTQETAQTVLCIVQNVEEKQEIIDVGYDVPVNNQDAEANPNLIEITKVENLIDQPEIVEHCFEGVYKCEPELEINDIGADVLDNQDTMEEGIHTEEDISKSDGNVDTQYEEMKIKTEEDENCSLDVQQELIEANDSCRNLETEIEIKIEENEYCTLESQEELAAPTYMKKKHEPHTYSSKRSNFSCQLIKRRQRFTCEFCSAKLMSLIDLRNHEIAAHASETILPMPEN